MIKAEPTPCVSLKDIWGFLYVKKQEEKVKESNPVNKPIKRNKGIRRIKTIILTTVLCLLLLLVPMTANAENTHVVHVRGDEEFYYGYYASYFTANGNTAFCLEVGIPNIPTGVYPISRYLQRGTGDDLLIKCAYYLWGGPGYDSIKNSLFSDPGSMVSYGLCHAAVSYVYTGNQSSAFTGLDGATVSHLLNVISIVSSQPMPPLGFDVYIYNEDSSSTQSFMGWDYIPTGSLEIRKVSGNTDMTDNNSCYSLEGAVFDVYNGSNQRIGRITTNASGRGRLDGIEAGQSGLYIVEVSPPKGYALNTSKISFEISAGQTTTVRVTDRPQNDPVGILLRKLDSDTSTPLPQGDAYLEGAEFTVKYYKGLYSNEGELSGLDPARTWILRTGINGTAYLHPDYLVSGDPFYYSGNNDPTLPLGTVTIQETKAPEGYLINNEIYIRQITSEGTAESVFTYNEPIVKENVIRGGVLIEKWDNETVKHKPQGGASFEGAVFEIINRSMNYVVVNGRVYSPGEAVYSITTDETGTAVTSNDLLPYGTYEVREVSPPDKGYLATGVLSRTFSIIEDVVIVELNTSETAIRNNPIRGDLRGVKISGGNHDRLAGIPFRITSKTTGENHEIVTDVNGEFNTSSVWTPHSNNTNRGLTEYDGIWFGETGTLNDELGALLYDRYLVEELRCEANKGMELLSFEVFIYRHNTVVNLGTLTNESGGEDDIPQIFTTAIDSATMTNDANVSEETVIIDTVYYSGLIYGEEYILKGILMDKATGEPLLIDGEQVTSEKAFTALSESGTVTMEFSFNSLALKGKSVVVFESLEYQGEEIAAHADIRDEGQTISFIEPKIKTSAAGKDNNKVIPLDKKAIITDTVTYYHLIPGETYILKGILMDQTTGYAVLVNGKEITAETVFEAEEASGSAEVVFTFDSNALEGKTLVVFECLETDGDVIASHEDIEDEAQTVTVQKNKPNPPAPSIPVMPKPESPFAKTSSPYTGRYGLPFFLLFIAIASLVVYVLLLIRACKKDGQIEKDD